MDRHFNSGNRQDYMNRVHKLFKEKKSNILSIFYTAGFPGLNDTVRIAESLQRSGADIIEIGIPFSDPVADGPTIQASNKIALDNGMNVKLLLSQVKEIRRSVTIPIILMGYLNPVLQFGIEAFLKAAAEAGVDGLILPDLPIDVYQHEYKELFDEAGLTNTFLISPTTTEDRIRKIDTLTSGFIYAVSASSTTGAKNDFTTDQLTYFEKLRSMHLKNPFLIGFGISGHHTFSTAAAYGSGAIVGSAFINLLNESKDFESDIKQFIGAINGEIKVPA
jgi:tryptophan synthase alpha chain